MIGVSVAELIILFVLFLFSLPFIHVLIDILRRDFGGNKKIVWLLAVIYARYVYRKPGTFSADEVSIMHYDKKQGAYT